MGKQYKPVEGGEECECYETACIECIMYGEAEENEEENEDE